MTRVMFGMSMCIVCAGVAFVALVPVFPWAPNGFVAVALLLLGFVALGVLRVPTAPLRPLRVTVSFGASIALAMSASLLTRPDASDRSAAFQHGAMALGAVIVLLTIMPRPRVAVALLVALALSGAHILWRLLFVVPLPVDAGPSQTIAFTVAAASSAAFVAALWHARHRWSIGSAPQRAS